MSPAATPRRHAGAPQPHAHTWVPNSAVFGAINASALKAVLRCVDCEATRGLPEAAWNRPLL